ncbi:transcriptional regulator [Shewanella sairae]|uniref:Transcriptional regulator n=1 Tax=Shewanella sairae TaxID=190310 RepID=A0ABQ4PEJ9_9GAMM|nr:metalloregulator ArsR/SmtB family transcription factor [Shewanella sairae]MCL1128646.1 metalloregulator ArsR/SmtB family transcription factor [Shewanella sairae]GIU45812.1 transcriptional regulator [Shewanella sairae]
MNIELMQQRADHAVVLLKALANERRLFILCYLLNEGEMCVGEMNKKLGLSQSALSQHLAWLRKDNLVETRKEAQTVYYSLKSDEVAEIIKLLNNIYCESLKTVA